MRYNSLLTMLFVLPSLLAGCRLPGRDGPVPASLASCRQYSQQGVAALERGQSEKAAELLAKAVKACPADPEARRNYAEALWQRGARAEAIAQLEQAARVANDDASLHVRLAEMHLAMSRLDAARKSAEQAVERNPRSAAAWAARGQVLRAAGDPQQALADCHRALRYAPDDRRILLEVAELQRQLNQPERALQTLQCVADTYAPGEESQQVLHLTGMAYMALGRYDDAVESLSTAVTRETATPEVFCRLAEAQWLAGHPAEAAASAQRALTLNPKHQPSIELLGRIETAQRTQQPLR
jgi:tetratricopeptide (TPR) repeat protein